jgi:hypothetical protein
MEVAMRMAQLTSMKQHDGVDGGSSGVLFGNEGVSSGEFFNVPMIQGGMTILEDKGSIDGLVQGEEMMRSLFAKFSSLSESGMSFAEMFNVMGPFPVMRQRMQTFIKFVGDTKLANLSVFNMANIPKTLSFKNSQQEQG